MTDIVERLQRLLDYKTLVSDDFAKKYGTVEDRVASGEYVNGFDVAFRRELVTLEDTLAEIRRLREREQRCKRVCFGAEVKGTRSWVSQEYADGLKAEVDRLREQVRMAREGADEHLTMLENIAKSPAKGRWTCDRVDELKGALRIISRNFRTTLTQLEES